MIKSLKKLLFKNQHHGEELISASFRNIGVAVFVFICFYLALPIYFTLKISSKYSVISLFIFYIVCFIIIILLVNTSLRRQRFSSISAQDIDEKINKTSYDIEVSEKLKTGLHKKLSRYHDLKKMVEALNKEISLQYVANTLLDICFEVLAETKGVVYVYLVDEQTNMLKLFASRKQDTIEVIKSKQGDIFDAWVIKHAQPLLIDDLSKDFRFDMDKLNEDSHKFSSLISVPFTSEKRILGLLRADNQKSNFFTQEDLGFLSTLSDLAAVALENALLYSRTRQLAIHDALTGLYTKGYFMERLKQEFQRSLRQGCALSVLMLDIDHFKKYNDKYGHVAGDIILQNLGTILSDFFEGKNTIICRFGGEEFVVLLPCEDKTEAKQAAEDLRKAVEKRKFIIRRAETEITLSIGLTSVTDKVADEDELLQKADACLYEAKQKGRNRVCYT